MSAKSKILLKKRKSRNRFKLKSQATGNLRLSVFRSNTNFSSGSSGGFNRSSGGFSGGVSSGSSRGGSSSGGGNSSGSSSSGGSSRGGDN